MTTERYPRELRMLRLRILLLDYLLGGVAFLASVLGLVILIVILVIGDPSDQLLPSVALSLVAATSLWILRSRLLHGARRRFEDAVWLFRSVTPQESTLYFNMALTMGGSLCALLNEGTDAEPRLSLISFTKTQYPRQERTPVLVYESETCRTLLVRMKDRYFDGTRLDRSTLAAEKRGFRRTMGLLLLGIALMCASVSGWALFEAWRMHQGLECVALSQHWPETSAEVLEVDLEERVRSTRSGKPSHRWRPRIRYAYSWGGERRYSTRLGCVDRFWSDRRAAVSIATAFEVGRSYPLRIDPDRPGQVRLIADDPSWIENRRTSHIGLAISILAVWLLTHVLLQYLLIRPNQSRLQQVEALVGWS